MRKFPPALALAPLVWLTACSASPSVSGAAPQATVPGQRPAASGAAGISPTPAGSVTAAPSEVPLPTATSVPAASSSVPATPAAVEAPPLADLPAEISIGNSSRRAVALTFDAGAGSAPTPQILNVLRRRNLRATFFLTARWARENPLLVRQIVQDGHEVANHTVTHRDLTALSRQQAADEITQAEEIISGIAGRSTKPWFRFPYGARNAALRRLVSQLGYRSVFWTVDSLDWQDGATVQSITSRVVKGARNGAIVLMHCGGMRTPAALPGIVDALQQSGYSFETMSEIVR